MVSSSPVLLKEKSPNNKLNYLLDTNWKPGGAAGTAADFVQTLALHEALQAEDSFFITTPLFDKKRLRETDARLLSWRATPWFPFFWTAQASIFNSTSSLHSNPESLFFEMMHWKVVYAKWAQITMQHSAESLIQEPYLCNIKLSLFMEQYPT